MGQTIRGIVTHGKIVPETPLPEGLEVEITVPEGTTAVPEDLQAELDAWALGSAEALTSVERLADEDAGDAQG
jgi:hypothetical protein